MNQHHTDLIREYLRRDYVKMFRPAGGGFKYPFLMPGASYQDMLWDWDSWLSAVALFQILADQDRHHDFARTVEHAQGCVLNYLEFTRADGAVPINVPREHANTGGIPEWLQPQNNICKPVLAQFAAFLVQQTGSADWLRPYFERLQRFHNYYAHQQQESKTGLYYWKNDLAIGTDNDPCTFARPTNSSGSIYLNSLMHREFLAGAFLAEKLGIDSVAADYTQRAAALQTAVQQFCWDRRDRFFYSVDFLSQLRPAFPWLHQGLGCFWPCLLLRVQVWSGFLGLWSGLATPAQAAEVARLHYRNEESFHARAGVRTLAANEPMYNLTATSNPSNWLGPVWIVSNYLTFRGLVRYGLLDDARDLVERTVRLLGEDLERHGCLHEFYIPETGAPVMNPGFMNWNFLVLNMIVWAEGGRVVSEF